MKRVLKILGITLGSIVGVVLIAVSLALWVVFTPDRLTPIVRDIAGDYITCEHRIGRVELSFFSTFPEFALQIDSVLIVNPCEGSSQDTLLQADRASVVLDVQSLWEKNELFISSLALVNTKAYVYISDSVQNFDIFLLPTDTTASDSSSMVLPFNKISVDELYVNMEDIVYEDVSRSIYAEIHNSNIKAYMHGWENITIDLALNDVSARMSGTVYADHLSARVLAPMMIDTELKSIELQDADLQVNQFKLMLDGIVTFADELSMQLHVAAQEWQVQPLLALLPTTIRDNLQAINVDGILSVEADVAGLLTETILPTVDATLTVAQAKGSYDGLPYPLRDVNMSADAHIDLNDIASTNLDVHYLTAKTKHSSVQVKGQVEEALGDMRLRLNVGANAYLPDFADFVPTNMLAKGRAKVQLQTDVRMSDLMQMNVDGAKVNGKIQWQDMCFSMDSLHATCPLVDMAMEVEGRDSMVYATLGIRSKQALEVSMDSMSAYVLSPDIHGDVAYNMLDSTAMPVAKVTILSDSLYAAYGEMMAALKQSTIMASLETSKRNKNVPRLKAQLQTVALKAKMDTTLSVTTDSLSLLATARYNASEENVLLQWNPNVEVELTNGLIRTTMLQDTLIIPKIDFTYSNRVFHIEDSQVKIGKSDFALSGEVRNMGKWMRENGDLQGELNFVSNHTDVNHFLEIFSADMGSEEVSDEQTSDTISTEMSAKEPFLVPTHLDLALNTHIKEASVQDEIVRDLKGRLYVKDGVLVLEEMGFVCKAAKLQLTAMYKTPRRNHIYVGLDYHMLDVNVEELVDLLPMVVEQVPMLNAFKGEVEFHLAAETYLNAEYKPKYSTMRGAASIFGKDMVVMSDSIFDRMAKLLMFNKKTENIVDSISAEITLYKKEVDVYPFAVSMDNYMFALGGRHNLDMSFNYDVNVLSPVYLGVNVSGTLDDLDIKLAPCKFAKDFKPVFHRKVDTQSAELRSMIRESMRKNVKIQ